MTSLFGIQVPEAASVPVVFAAAIAPLGIYKLLFNTYENYRENPKKHENNKPTKTHITKPEEFGGPYIAQFFPLMLPCILYFLHLSCNKDNFVSLLPWSPDFLVYKVNPFANGIQGFISQVWDIKMFLWFTAWVFFQFFLYLVVPGPIVEGTELANKQKTRLRYKINAFRCHIITLLILGTLVYYNILEVTFIYDNLIQLLTGSIVSSTLFSIILYLHSIIAIPIPKDGANPGDKNPLHQLSITGASGYTGYDFWMGRTLNPRLGFLDLSYICELRPGLIFWNVMNLSYALTQYVRTGTISPSMILVTLFHAYYTFDSHWNEQAILTTMDVTTDGFGFMLVFGDLTWVPFSFSLQTKYILEHPTEADLPAIVLGAIVLLNFLGMYIFRSSNSQKNTFRNNPEHPSVKNLPYIQTTVGTRLLTGGWWGLSRHMNYLGDIIVGISWCLPTGFSAIIPYFYCIYFIALLINRQKRDDMKCQAKYGEDWDKYCATVKYKICPYIY